MDNPMEQTQIPSQPAYIQPTPIPQKSKLPLVLGMIVLLFVFVGAGVVLGKFLFTQPTTPVVEKLILPTPSPAETLAKTETPTPDPTINWKTYQNKNGYSIKYPSTLTVVPDTGMTAPKDITEATGISVRNQNLADPLTGPQLNLYVFSLENTVYKNLSTLREIADANLKDNNHPETLIKIIEGVHETQFNGELAYEYTIESKGFFAGWSGFLGEQGIAKIVTFKHNGKYFQIGLYDTPVFNQILSTFKFLDQTQTDETANWKTYTNSKPFAFQLKYPPDWTEKDMISSGWPSFESSDNGIMTFNAGPIPDQNNLSNYCPTRTGIVQKNRNITVDGIPVIFCVDNSISQAEITIPKNENIYAITCSLRKLDICLQILSTFKFTN
jgi:hypothetical protein